MKGTHYITVWKDGTWIVWSYDDAIEAKLEDSEWFTNISLEAVSTSILHKDAYTRKKERKQLRIKNS